MAELKDFPSISDVHTVLEDLNKLFEDRNALLHSMWKEDKYKDFLLAESVQQLVEADKRDDDQDGRIKRDLANGFDILNAKTTMRKFSNFVNPGMIPPMDLTNPDDYEGLDEKADELDPPEPEVVEGPAGEDGADGKDGKDAVAPPSKTKVNITPNQTSGEQSQAPSKKMAAGGVGLPGGPFNPAANFLNPGAQRPETKGSTKSLESMGLVGDKNPVSELSEDLGLDKYKKALTDAMALPMRAVAAGLSGLLDSINMPGEEYQEVRKQVDAISTAFEIPKPSSQSVGDTTNITRNLQKDTLIAGGGIFSTMKSFFGLAKDRDHGVSDKTIMGGVVNSLQQRRQMLESFGDGDMGGPSLMGMLKGAPMDNLSTSVNTTINDSMTKIQSMQGGMKNMSSVMNTKNVNSAVSSLSSVLNQTLGGIQPADAGSTVKTDINNLTNQVLAQADQLFAPEMIQSVHDLAESDQMKNVKRQMELAARNIKIDQPDMKNPVPEHQVNPSKYMLSSISMVLGGETIVDLL